MSFFSQLLARFDKPARADTAPTAPASVPSAPQPEHDHGPAETHEAPVSELHSAPPVASK